MIFTGRYKLFSLSAEEQEKTNKDVGVGLEK